MSDIKKNDHLSMEVHKSEIPDNNNYASGFARVTRITCIR